MTSAGSKLLRVTCARGLVPYLRAELEGLGYAIQAEHPTALELEGSRADAMRLNLCLRTAYHVLEQVGEFACPDPNALYQALLELPWETLIPADGYLSVASRVDTPSVDNTMFASLKVKDAIVDRIARERGRRPDSGPKRDRAVVTLYWKGTRAWVYLDTSGLKLSDRGYRRSPHRAPLRESLAAGLLLAAGYDPAAPLVLPMCGSGTLAIEAALIACGRAPGLLRPGFAFQHLADHDPGVFEALREETRRRRLARPPAPIVASDHDPRALEAARRNARTAGVEEHIAWHRCDFAETPLPGEGGLVLLNPEYGQRLGQSQALAATYRRIGDFFKQRCTGRTGYIFTGNRGLAKKVGLRTSRKLPFFNGELECRLLRYELYAGSRKQKKQPGTHQD